MTSIIILAAGKGSRMNLGYNKMNYQFLERPLYTYPIEKFKRLGYEDIILVCNEDIVYHNCRTVTGGKERMFSVYNGLKEAKGDYVMIHDGARPFVSDNKIKEIEDALKTNDCVLLASKVKDTIKIYKDGYLETLDRNSLIAAETPQAFKKDLILNAMEKAINDKYLALDDVSIIEKYTDSKVKIIYNDSVNMKLTTKDDIVLAEYLFNKEMK